MSATNLAACRRWIGRVAGRLAIATLALMPTACSLLEGPEPANPLLGTWTTPEHDRIAFGPDGIVLMPEKGQQMRISKEECGGVYNLAYGRMRTAPFEELFPKQPDLRAQIKELLVKPEYPVADLTCDKGGTTYLMIGDRDLVAIYRDGSVGGIQRLTRL